MGKFWSVCPFLGGPLAPPFRKLSNLLVLGEDGAYMTSSLIFMWYPKKLQLNFFWDKLTFPAWFHYQFKKHFTWIGCINNFLWLFEIAWLGNLLSRFDKDLAELWIWRFDCIFWNGCHFYVFEPRNPIFSIQPSIVLLLKKINWNLLWVLIGIVLLVSHE